MVQQVQNKVPVVLSCVTVHCIHQLIVESHQIADQACGTQAWTLPTGQEVPEVTVQVQIPAAKFFWNFYFIYSFERTDK